MKAWFCVGKTTRRMGEFADGAQATILTKEPVPQVFDKLGTLAVRNRASGVQLRRTMDHGEQSSVQ